MPKGWMVDPVERLVASVGNSPLPVARWLAVLQPRRLMLPPDVPFEIFSAIRQALGVEPASILYGGGTTPMNVMLNQWWLAYSPLEHAYYAAAKDGRLHREDGDTVAHDPARACFTIESIMNLHLDPQTHHVEFGPRHVSELAARPSHAERVFLGEAAELILDGRAPWMP
jgi:hypothetical protein